MEVIGLHIVLQEDKKKMNLLKEENKMVSDCPHLLESLFKPWFPSMQN